MSCAELQNELIGYHFGTLDDATRREVEAHLVACPACVQAFVELKRDIESGEVAPAPSEASRLRLRRAVAQELGLAPRRRWSWWERPLAFTFAGAALVIALALLSLIATGSGQTPRSLQGEPAAPTAPSQTR